MKKFINRKIGMKIIKFNLILGFLTFVYGLYGVKYNQDIFTQKEIFDEMAGIIPFIILLSSFLLILIAIIVKLFMKKQIN